MKFTSALLKFSKYDNSTVQAIYDEENTKTLLDFTKLVKDEDIFVDKDIKGRETNPHITVLYGIHEKEPSKLDLTSLDLPESVEWIGLGKFETDEYEVLIVKIKKTTVIQDLFDYINEVYPDNDNSFPTYEPHTTIAYVKKGMADSYIESYGEWFTEEAPIRAIQFAFNNHKWDFDPKSGEKV